MVSGYCEWMKDPFIQEMTSTEEMSLDEHYQIQKDYILKSNEQVIFLIMDLNSNQETQEQVSIQNLSNLIRLIQNHNKDQPETKIDISKVKLIGDINLFLKRNNDDPLQGELNIMIAEKQAQRKGLAQETIMLIMKYGAQKFGLTNYIAKISMKNLASINLFKKLGFKVIEELEVFEEIHFGKQVDEDILNKECKLYQTEINQ
eukprot:403350879